MQADKIWQAALGELQLQVNKANFNTWLKDTKGIDYCNGIFTIAVPSTFIAEWLKSRLYSIVSRILCSITGQNVEVQFQVQSVSRDVNMIKPHMVPDGGISLKERPSPAKAANLNPRFTFSTFIAGDCNRLPFTAAVEISGNPGETFNPLYIYGGTGTGKTHLLHAIGHAVRSLDQSVLYISAEQFTNDFIGSIKNHKAEEFRNKFNDIDLLLVDDIQFLSCKTQTQECIFHILNDYLDDSRQVVITCDRPPKEISALNIRLRSRLEGGLVADIYPPDHKTRLSILELKAQQLKMAFDPAVLNFLATHFYHSVRELEGALIRLTTYARMNGYELNVNLAKQLLGDMITVSKQSVGYFQPATIINTVADYYALSPEDITGKKRDLKTSRARHIVMYLLRQQNHCNLAEIGKVLGDRDHSTVIHGCEKISSEISVDSNLSKTVEDIRALLKATRTS
jgi:chromosomal replication initiator protein